MKSFLVGKCMLGYSCTLLALALLVSLSGCGNDSTQAGVDSLTGQQLLNKVSQNLDASETYHGTFNLSINGPTSNGTANTEVWNKMAKKRVVVLQSSLNQFINGAITVTDSKKTWQYYPAKQVVYTDATGTSTQNNTYKGAIMSPLDLVQPVFSGSIATLVSSPPVVNEHTVYDVHVVPNDKGNQYSGEVYVDKKTQLPVQIKLDVEGLGKLILDIPKLDVGAAIPDDIFAFTPPKGVKVMSFSDRAAKEKTLPLDQAKQQAGYHLLGIPPSQTAYKLSNVVALDISGSQVYTLNYRAGNDNIAIVEGKSLASRPDKTGTAIQVRGSTGTFSTENGVATLSWTENEVGISITGLLSSDQLQEIAKMLV